MEEKIGGNEGSRGVCEVESDAWKEDKKEGNGRIGGIERLIEGKRRVTTGKGR